MGVMDIISVKMDLGNVLMDLADLMIARTNWFQSVYSVLFSVCSH